MPQERQSERSRQATPIEEALIKEGIITPEQLETLKVEQERSSVSIVEAVRRLKVIDEDVLLDFLSRKLNIKRHSLKGFIPSPDILNKVPPHFARGKKIIPLFQEGKELAVGMADPLDFASVEELRFGSGLFVKPYLVKEDEVLEFLSSYYPESEEDIKAAPRQKEKEREDVEKPSIVRSVNLLILQAVKAGASDIHIEPLEDSLRVRFRVDGVLHEVTPPEKYLYSAIVSRIKIMSNLDIAEKRIPQDGRFQTQVGERSIDVRVSTIPMIYGESIVLRLLEQTKKVLTLEEIGFLKDDLSVYRRLIQQTAGVVLVTGPTGSGKTTTLYASLMEIKSVEKNIITIEDPVEYHLDFARQIQINSKVNLTFASGLRSILRHDPDIVMVGEIRDLETAEIATQAALTGHLVFSTLHTNDAPSAITRLVNMGVEPFLVASCVKGVVAQRLVRVLCTCKKQRKIKLSLLHGLLRLEQPKEDKEVPVFEAGGCQNCMHTGYRGRVAIFEIMEMNDDIGALTVEKKSSEDIKRLAVSGGMHSLQHNGLDRILAGVTSPEEAVRVLGA
ncbi:MAG: GspE/PulE family protein [Candidatus Omnitrophica bacterium]|nr:GspE/PulE family protein [Candidatus Omnitrophota bacterium]